MPRTRSANHRCRPRLGKKAYGLLLNAAKVAGVLSLIYGVGFGIFQYYEAKKEKRIEESLTLFREFNNALFTDYQSASTSRSLTTGRQSTARWPMKSC
jgi:hypothetical protein